MQEYSSPPWWTPDLIIQNEIHYNYERYFPISEYIEELRSLLASILPNTSWVPLPLKKNCYRSLVEFWQKLPQHLAGKVMWERHELLPLACALASPRKNGCHLGRYPEQTTYLRNWLDAKKITNMNVLDYGCSTASVTYEIAGILEQSLQAGRIIAVTREPLEAWMASKRCLPHFDGVYKTDTYQPEEDFFPANPQHVDLYFIAGDIRQFSLRHPVDLIICNGLIGGEQLNNSIEFIRLWHKFKNQLLKGGILMIGSRFHAGFKKKERQFVELHSDFMKLTYHSSFTYVFTNGVSQD